MSAAFSANYLPLATQAGQALGVSPSTVLAQWALESGYGTSNAAVSGNNLAGLGPGQTFASPAAFENAYVATIQNNFPGAENTGGNVAMFVQGLTNSAGQIYYGTGATADQYASSLTGTLANLMNNGVQPQSMPMVATGAAGGVPVASTGATPGTATTAAAAPAAGACSGLTGAFTWSCWQNVITDLAFVAIGVLIFIVAVGVGLFGSHAQAAVRHA